MSIQATPESTGIDRADRFTLDLTPRRAQTASQWAGMPLAIDGYAITANQERHNRRLQEVGPAFEEHDLAEERTLRRALVR